MSNDTIKKYKSGCIAATLQTLLVYPLDVIRVKSFIQTTVGKWLYNGLLFTIMSNIFRTSLYYPTQDIISHYFDNDRQTEANLIVCILTSILTTPINSIKTPLQISSTIKINKVISEIYNKYGIKGFYRGSIPICFRDSLWTVIYFKLFNNYNYNDNNRLLASIYSSTIAATLTYPFDSSRICMQHHKHTYKFWYGFRESFQPTFSNLKSFATGNLRVTFATCIGHYTYLWMQDNI